MLLAHPLLLQLPDQFRPMSQDLLILEVSHLLDNSIESH